MILATKYYYCLNPNVVEKKLQKSCMWKGDCLLVNIGTCIILLNTNFL